MLDVWCSYVYSQKMRKSIPEVRLMIAVVAVDCYAKNKRLLTDARAESIRKDNVLRWLKDIMRIICWRDAPAIARALLASTKTCNALHMTTEISGLACARLTHCFVICPVAVHTRPHNGSFLKLETPWDPGMQMIAVFVTLLLWAEGKLWLGARAPAMCNAALSCMER